MDSSRWWNEETVALVTGGNKGIGLEVCKQLAEKGLKVVLTARDEKRGRAAMKVLVDQGLTNVQFHPLDVQDDQSVATLVSWLLKEHGGLDILINNAAIGGLIIDKEYVEKNNIDLADLLLKQETSKGFIIEYESAKECIETNYYGAKRVTKALVPLLRPSLGGARIVNVGSDYGQLLYLRNRELQKELSNLGNLSERYIDEILEKYLSDVMAKTWEEEGWQLKFPNYKMSKVALHAYTRILAKELETRPPNQRIFVNCVHPGYVKTDLTNHHGDITPQQGALNVVRVALLSPHDSPSGVFFFEEKLGNYEGQNM